MMDATKYAPGYYPVPAGYDSWVKKDHIEKAPAWCSVDLRDGNQALIVPMSLEEKLEFFQMLVKIGFKEIEVGFPAASDTEYEFLRTLIEKNMIPEDVTVQVLTQCRDHIIRKTFEAVKGAPRAVIHFYNSTSVAQREQVFHKSREETEYMVVMLVTPVGPYFKEGFKPTRVCMSREYDRVAPKGTGSIKVGGNYAASLVAGEKAHELGYSVMLYIDPKEKKYLDECGAANFFGIKGNKYVTPFSESILPSITNKSLVQLAEDLGMEVERRHIPIAELEEFDEASACGTAAVCSPISEIDDLDTGKKYIFSTNGEAGPMTTKLYNKLRAVQLGDEEDVHGWNCILD